MRRGCGGMSGRDSVGCSANFIWWNGMGILCFGTVLREVLISLSSSPGHQRGNMFGMEISLGKWSWRKLFGHKQQIISMAMLWAIVVDWSVWVKDVWEESPLSINRIWFIQRVNHPSKYILTDREVSARIICGLISLIGIIVWITHNGEVTK